MGVVATSGPGETLPEEQGGEGDGLSLLTVAVPAVGSLLVTWAVASLVCQTPAHPFRRWWELLGYAAGMVLLAGCVQAAAVWGICRVFREQLGAGALVRMVRRGVWWSALLLPMEVLLERQASAWSAAVPAVLVGAVVLFLRRAVPEAGRSAQGEAPGGIAGGVMRFREPPALPRTLLPWVAVVLLVDGAVALLLSWQPAWAGLLLGVGTAMALWRVPLRAAAGARAGGGQTRMWWQAAMAVMLTAVALLPSLAQSRVAGVAARLLHGGGPAAAGRRTSVVEAHVERTGGELSGVVLTLPPKPQERRVEAPPSVGTALSVGLRRPLILPFDGAYWYFHQPDTQPRANAKRVRGDPTKVDIRSTDMAPLLMEAHQRVSPAIGMGCCAEIRVAMRNADDRPGEIAVELVLEGHGTAPWRVSLGERVLASSRGEGIALNRAPVEEVLRFRVPAGMEGRSIDEITVAVRPAALRALAGAHVAVERFELVP